MNNGFFRAIAAVPTVQPCDVEANTAEIISMLNNPAFSEADMVVFPELSLTGYTCGDIFHNSTLLDAVGPAIERVANATSRTDCPLVIIGAPIIYDGILYNCAVALGNGRVLAVIPKTYIPGYNEFYEKRWWASAPERTGKWISPSGDTVPFGTKLLLTRCGVKIAIEICEDLWTPIAPSCKATLAGAEVVANLSASDELIGKYKYLSDLIRQQSDRCLCGYVYSSAGYGESSTDLVFDGKAFVVENGWLLASNHRWQRGSQYAVADIDIEALRRDRLHITSFGDCRRRNVDEEYLIVDCGGSLCENKNRELLRYVSRLPFVPADDFTLRERCEEAIDIQVAGLCRRLEFTHCRSLVVGISGGLDSTLALLVAVRAFDKLGLDRKGICGVTMPGFGTTGRTHGNAVTLMEALGVTTREIPIADAVNQHFADIGHDPAVHDVTYENSQARERTQILMDIANQLGGMVLGTGDLSELALGWATYNGDHMSMYGVNAGVPKTLVKHLTRYFAMTCDDELCRKTLFDIIDTPISPELIPAAENGEIKQKTEDLVGPYELHDFFLYYTLRFGFRPSRIFMLALKAFDGEFDRAVIKHWMTVFFRRFFAQQFKRSCMPDGPKVGSVCLSPRGDWRMPSDASSALWLSECEKL